MKHFQLLLAISVMFCVGMPNSYAQVTAATLTGSVVDGQGKPLDAATVAAIHQPSGAQYGHYLRPLLRICTGWPLYLYLLRRHQQ